MKKIVLTVVGGFMLMAVYGQNPQGQKLSFKEAVSFGLKNNVVLNQQKNQLEYTQVNKISTILQMGPNISANGSVYRSDGNSFNQNEGKVVNGVIDFVNGSLNANMPLFSGFTYLNQARAASNANEAQQYQVVRSNQDVIRDVAAQFLSCLLDQELIKINQENVNAQTVIYNQIKEQVDLGSKAESDLFTQDYQVKNAELVLFRSNNTLHNDIATLALTLQVDPTLYFEVEQVNWDINELLTDSSAYEDMYATAVTRRADLKQAEHFEKAAHYSFSSVKGRYYPSIYAGASYSSRYNYIQGDVNRSFSDQFTKDNVQLQYGLNVSIPIFNGWLYKSQAAFSRVAYK
ncbi:MAG TPA: TolC family protein, partial [Chryseolinea sp.]|nr:TolC family protein [Chryseolinea sp.]